MKTNMVHCVGSFRARCSISNGKRIALYSLIQRGGKTSVFVLRIAWTHVGQCIEWK